MSAVTVIGIGADGWPGVRAALRQQVLDAEVVLGGARHLAMLPDAGGQVRESWPSPLREGLPALLWKHDGKRVVALASGDPFVSGIGGTLVELLGRSAVVVEPAVSSVALARARMGWDDATVETVTVVGRDAHVVLRSLAPGHRLVVLSSDAGTPSEVAALLVGAGYGSSRMTVLGDLGSRDETRLSTTASAWEGRGPQLHAIALELDGPLIGGWSAGLPDDAFEHDGQLTKRDLRASALARLAPTPRALLWDVGAGAGSVGIEWMRAHPTCRTIAVEGNAERAARTLRNARALGVPALRVVEGRAPEALAGLPRPDAIFVGGGATADGMIENCLAVLGSGGRLVVHGVTVETEAVLAAAHKQHGGELTRHQVETTAPIGSFTGWTPARAVTQWALVKETP